MHRNYLLVTLLFLAVAICPGLVQAENPINCRTRSCYDRLVDDYLAALVAHDPSRLAFAPDARFVENIKATRIGDGLWKTASAVPTTFRIYVPDPVSGQVGFIGFQQEGGTPVMLALRLKVIQGHIVEAEHIIARDLPERCLANLRTPRLAFT